MARMSLVTAENMQQRAGARINQMEGTLWEGLLGSCPKLGVPFLGVPIIRTIVFWGLCWDPPI